jgi:hypothetical protein
MVVTHRGVLDVALRAAIEGAAIIHESGTSVTAR